MYQDTTGFLHCWNVVISSTLKKLFVLNSSGRMEQWYVGLQQILQKK